MRSSIRNRLLSKVLSVTVTIWLVTAWTSYRVTQHEVGEIFDAQLAQSARNMLAISSHELLELAKYPENKEHIHFILEIPRSENTHHYEHNLAYQIWQQPEGILMIRSINAPPSALSDDGEGFSDRTINGELWRIFTLKDAMSGYEVQMGESYAPRNELINEVALRLAIPLLVALPLLGLLISYAIHQALAPLRNLTRAVEQRAPDSLEPMAEQNAPLEIRPLIAALNHLFARLETAFENERRFTADAAHELRTPLAALKVQAQVAQRATEDAQRKVALDSVVQGVDRATRLVEQLLTLARLDPQHGLITSESIALYPLCAEVVADLDQTAHQRRMEITLEGDTAAQVAGQRDSLRILITNLVDNALRHAPEEGQVHVTVSSQPDGVVLQVDDSGPGIPDAELEQVFERFYRGREVTSSGSGLGLSIVKRIADLHGAIITLARSELGGLQVCVKFFPSQAGNRQTHPY